MLRGGVLPKLSLRAPGSAVLDKKLLSIAENSHFLELFILLNYIRNVFILRKFNGFNCFLWNATLQL